MSYIGLYLIGSVYTGGGGGGVVPVCTCTVYVIGNLCIYCRNTFVILSYGFQNSLYFLVENSCSHIFIILFTFKMVF